jgi:hypothetical protein
MARKDEDVKSEIILGDTVKLLRHFDAADRPIHPRYKNYIVMAIDGQMITIGKNDEVLAVMRLQDLKK